MINSSKSPWNSFDLSPVGSIKKIEPILYTCWLVLISIRVRQEALKKIYDTDVISKQPYNGKQVTNDVLSTITELYTIDEKLVSKIKDYQIKEELQNERGLDKYIDKILTEKAEKNADEVLDKQ